MLSANQAEFLAVNPGELLSVNQGESSNSQPPELLDPERVEQLKVASQKSTMLVSPTEADG